MQQLQFICLKLEPQHNDVLNNLEASYRHWNVLLKSLVQVVVTLFFCLVGIVPICWLKLWLDYLLVLWSLRDLSRRASPCREVARWFLNPLEVSIWWLLCRLLHQLLTLFRLKECKGFIVKWSMVAIVAKRCLWLRLILSVVTLTEFWFNSITLVWWDVYCWVGRSNILQCLRLRFQRKLICLPGRPCWYRREIPLDICLLRSPGDLRTLQPSCFWNWLCPLVFRAFLREDFVRCRDVDWTSSSIIIQRLLTLHLKDSTGYDFSLGCHLRLYLLRCRFC